MKIVNSFLTIFIVFFVESVAQADFTKERIVEKTFALPAKVHAPKYALNLITLPQSSSIGFATEQHIRNAENNFSNKLSYFNNSNPFNSRVILENKSNPVCGPSPWANTLSCYSAENGTLLANIPIPGSLTLSPYFSTTEKSWVFGTSKGVLIRTEQTLGNLPELSKSSLAFWSQYNRLAVANVRNLLLGNKVDTSFLMNTSPSKLKLPVFEGIKWIQASSAEFVGSPLRIDDVLYVLTASQYLHAYDWNTGKLLNAVRLSPEASLRLTSNSLTSSKNNEILVGTEDGSVLALQHKKLSILFRYQVTKGVKDRFSSIVAKPLVDGNSFIVSNSESNTERVTISKNNVEWNYPLGSISEIKSDNNIAFIGGNEGTLLALDIKTGVLKWKTLIDSGVPIASTFILNSQETRKKVIFSITINGELALVDPDNGVIIDRTKPFGQVVGEFFSPDAKSACISFVNASFRCFSNSYN